MPKLVQIIQFEKKIITWVCNCKNSMLQNAHISGYAVLIKYSIFVALPVNNSN